MEITPKTRNIVVWIGCVAIGILFAGAAVAKWNYIFPLEKDVMAFFGSAEGFPPRVYQFMPRFLIALELALGISLLQPYWRKRVLLPLVMLILLGFTGYLFTLDPTQKNCGCFGAWMAMGPHASIIKNLLMLAVCSICWGWSKPDPAGKAYVAPILLALACAVVFTSLPLRPPPPPDRPQFADLDMFENTEDGHLPQRGAYLLAFLNATCEHCEAFAEYLADCEYPLYLAINDEGEGLDTVREFREMTDIDQFPWMLTNDDLFYPHIGQAPPRIYIVVDGKPIKHWEGKIDMNQVKEQFVKIADECKPADK